MVRISPATVRMAGLATRGAAPRYLHLLDIRPFFWDEDGDLRRNAD
jgi:hypothetical protein